jgi:TPR repeat protein
VEDVVMTLLQRIRIASEALVPPLLIAALLQAAVMPVASAATVAEQERGIDQLQLAASHGEPAAIAAYADALAARKNGGALLKLAEALSKGSPAEREMVTAVYEKAGEAGRGVAWVMLAQIYARGAGVKADAAKSAAYYRRGIAAGRADAMFGLGKALVQRTSGMAGTQAEGLVLVRQAEALGHAEATAFIGECQVTGVGMARDVKKGLAALHLAWESGNSAAALQLIAFYRDGRKGIITRNRFLAEYYYRKAAPSLVANEAAVQRLLLDAASPGKRGDFASLARGLGQIDGAKKRMVVRKMRVLNPNAYVYLVQSRLRELDLYAGTPNGLLSRRTVKAMQSYCMSVADHESCRRGPMAASASEAISLAF